MKVMILKDLSVLWSLFHVLILFILLYRSKYPQKKTFLLTVLFMGPLILLNIVAFISLGSEKMGQLFLLTCTLPSLIFFYLMSKDQKWRFLFTFCFADTAAYWIIIVTNMLEYYIGDGKNILIFGSRLLLFPLIEWFAVRYLRKPYMELQEAVSKGWEIFAAMAALYYLLLVVMGNFPSIIVKRQEEIPAFILVLILMPLTYCTIFASLYRQLLLYRKQQSERIWKEQRQQLEAQLENQQRVHKIRHDLKAHAITLSGLLVSGKVDEAQSYMWNMIYDMDTSQQSFCSNPYLNSVFSHFSNKFKKLEMELQLDVQIGEEELPYMELCQILSNALENAWDASKELAADRRKASVQMRYNRDYLIIRIKNHCKNNIYVKKGEIPKSTKGGAEHGFGVRTIQDAARKLEGEMLCYTEDNNFVLDVMLKVL
ncbi:MAG: GHKL domain-containing protein [Lachnospiraceae bacterium]